MRGCCPPRDAQEDNINSLETRHKWGPCWTSTLKSRQTRAAAAAAAVLLLLVVVAAAILRGGLSGEGEEGGRRAASQFTFIHIQANHLLARQRKAPGNYALVSLRTPQMGYDIHIIYNS